MPVKLRKPKSRLPDFTPEQRAWYAALNEPSYEMHHELGLRPWHDTIRPGFASLDDAVDDVLQELAIRHGKAN